MPLSQVTYPFFYMSNQAIENIHERTQLFLSAPPLPCYLAQSPADAKSQYVRGRHQCPDETQMIAIWQEEFPLGNEALLKHAETSPLCA